MPSSSEPGLSLQLLEHLLLNPSFVEGKIGSELGIISAYQTKQITYSLRYPNTGTEKEKHSSTSNGM